MHKNVRQVFAYKQAGMQAFYLGKVLRTYEYYLPFIADDRDST